MFSITTISTLSALVWAASPITAPDESVPQDRTLYLDVDVSDLGADGTGVDDLVREKLVPTLEAAGFEIVSDAGATVDLSVRFEALRLDKFDYGIHFEVIDDTNNGGSNSEVMPWVACLGCMDAKLLPLLDEHSGELVDALVQRTESTGSAPTAPSHTPTEHQPTRASVDPVAPIGPIGGVGIGVMALGLGAVVWGSIDLGRVSVVSGPSDATRVTTTDYSPRGKAWLGVGVGALVGGSALLITDLVIRSKRRDRAGRSALVPSIGPEQVGLVWTRRF